MRIGIFMNIVQRGLVFPFEAVKKIDPFFLITSFSIVVSYLENVILYLYI